MKPQKCFFEGKEYPLGYRVVTLDMKSLGLRNNPNILVYPVNEWFVLPEDQIKAGSEDWGGIWVARTFGLARNLQRYMSDKHHTETRLFRAALKDILYFNSYRIKTTGVNLFEEIKKEPF